MVKIVESNMVTVILDRDSVVYSPSERIRQAVTVSNSLANSFKSQGIIEPIVVTKASDGNYMLIHGKKRLNWARENKRPVRAILLEGVEPQDLIQLEMILNSNEPLRLHHKLKYAEVLKYTMTPFDPIKIDDLLGLHPGEYLMACSVLSADLTTIPNATAVLTGKDVDKLEKYREEMMEGELSIRKAHDAVNKLIKAIEKRADAAQSDEVESANNLNDTVAPLPDRLFDLYDRPIPLEIRYTAIESAQCQCGNCMLKGKLYKNTLKATRVIPSFAGGDDTYENIVVICPTCDNLLDQLALSIIEIPSSLSDSFKLILEVAVARKEVYSEMEIPRESLLKLAQEKGVLA